MVVDDEPDLLDLLAQLLRLQGHEVVPAASAAEALERAKDWKPDLLVTDLRMSGLDGIELARRIKEAHADLRVVVLTAYADSTLGSAAVAQGRVDAVCRKTIDPEELLQLVGRLLPVPSGPKAGEDPFASST